MIATISQIVCFSHRLNDDNTDKPGASVIIATARHIPFEAYEVSYATSGQSFAATLCSMMLPVLNKGSMYH